MPQRVLTIKKHRLHIPSLQQHLFPYFRKESLFSSKAGSADSGILISDFDLPASDILLFRVCLSNQTVRNKDVSNKASGSPGD